MEPNSMHGDSGNKSGADSEDYTSASSAEGTEAEEDGSDSDDSVEMVVMINKEEKGQAEQPTGSAVVGDGRAEDTVESAASPMVRNSTKRWDHT